MERASGNDGPEWLPGLEDPVSARAMPFFEQMLERRLAGEPLQYVLGRWAFRSLDLVVDRRVLIPRPETETVVEIAIDELRRVPLCDAAAPRCLDLGTGSGAIALSLAVEVERSEVWAVDRSPDALAVARANLSAIGTFAAPRVRLLEGSWFSPLPEGLRRGFHLVVANPPYIADDEVLDDVVAAWEPREALRAGPRGTEDADVIVREAGEWLVPGGVLVVELAPHQAEHAVAVALAAGFERAEARPDLTGRLRALVARARQI